MVYVLDEEIQSLKNGFLIRYIFLSIIGIKLLTDVTPFGIFCLFLVLLLIYMTYSDTKSLF